MSLLPFEYAVRNLGRSRLRLALSIASSALASVLVIAGVGFLRGLDRALGESGLERNVILLGAGSEESIERSEISQKVATLATTEIDGVRWLPEPSRGVPFVSPEVHAALPIEGGPIVVFRGVTPSAHLVHPQVRIVEGRASEPGSDELTLGLQAQAALRRAGLDAGIGSSIRLGVRELPVVGVFAAPGTAFEGEAWMPLASLRDMAQRDTDSCVVLTLADGADPADVDVFAVSRVDLELAALRETDYYAALGRFLAPVRWLVLATSVIVAFGALLGGLGTLDVAFAARIRELGTLQALGFRRRAIALSFLQESLLIASVGALGAAAVAMLVLDGVAVRSSMGTFAISVDAVTVLCGFIAALALGVVGAALPAFRCLRRPVPDALRAAT